MGERRAAAQLTPKLAELLHSGEFMALYDRDAGLVLAIMKGICLIGDSGGFSDAFFGQWFLGGSGHAASALKFEQNFWIRDSNSEKSFGGTSGLATALFPILQGTSGHAQQACKGRLRKANSRSCLCRLRHLDLCNS